MPFGRGSQSRVALVFSVEPAPEERTKLKFVSSIADSEPVISTEMLHLCKWIRDNTFCTYFDAFRAILPPGLSYTLQTRYEPVNGFSGELDMNERQLLERISQLRERYSPDAADRSLLKSLTEKGAVRESELLKRRVGDETTLMVKIAEQPEGAESPKLTPKQKQVIAFLEENSAASVHEVCYALNITAAVVKRLVEKGILEEYEYQVFRLENTVSKTESPSDIVFSPKQQAVFDGCLSLMNSDQPKCALLRGITGSGKTSVFIRLIDEAVKQGKSAVMLVPGDIPDSADGGEVPAAVRRRGGNTPQQPVTGGARGRIHAHSHRQGAHSRRNAQRGIRPGARILGSSSSMRRGKAPTSPRALRDTMPGTSRSSAASGTERSCFWLQRLRRWKATTTLRQGATACLSWTSGITTRSSRRSTSWTCVLKRRTGITLRSACR